MSSIPSITPVIIAGGSGSRLWPLSRHLRPKQFLKLQGENSLLQQTLIRLEGLNCAAPVLICNEEHRFLVAEQLRDIDIKDASLLLEPIGRNTAPAVALGALQSQQTSHKEDNLLLVLAADHSIKDLDAFQVAIKKAIFLAEQGYLVTFGINPTKPETGYGYIQKGNPICDGFTVQQFVEKPDRRTAEEYIESGTYLWNSGMFLMRADRYLEALNQYAPIIYNNCNKAMEVAVKDLDFIRVCKESFEKCPNESIDYAVMEKDEKVAVVSLDADWSDIGSWSSLWEISEKDKNNNVIKGDVVTENTSNTLICADYRLVATVGVDNLIIVETKDAILIARQDEDQHVKDIVKQLKKAGRAEYENHREVYRPWGKYDSIDIESRYQVKRITVNPGQKLSIQMHHHRSEHWIVVSGTALVSINGEERLVTENESVYIPLGATHFMQNPGKIPLELIEVQSGAYLGEDDIVRFEDVYGR